MMARKGYIALTSVLVMGAIFLVIGIAICMTSTSELQVSLAGTKGNEALYTVESCVEEVLISYRNNNSLPNAITLPQQTCTVTIESQTASNVTFVVSSTDGLHSKSVRVSASKSDRVSVNSWEEIE